MNWSAPCELGEMRYKFRFKCTEGFQLVDPSDFGLTLQAITLTVKKFLFCLFYVTDSKISLLQNEVQI